MLFIFDRFGCYFITLSRGGTISHVTFLINSLRRNFIDLGAIVEILDSGLTRLDILFHFFRDFLHLDLGEVTGVLIPVLT
jgi:hypothetical protein